MRWSAWCAARTVLMSFLMMLAHGCSVEPVVTETRPPLTVEGQELLDRLEGKWSLQVTVAGDCPPEWRRALPAGQVTCRADSGALYVSSVGSASPDFTLYPVDGESLA